MKIINKKKSLEHNSIRNAMTERNVLAEIDSPFIVKLHFAF
jgi:hypothetical protein